MTAEEHIIKVLRDTKTTESEYLLESSHFKVNRKRINKIN